jgi:hypothetical protein
MKYLVKKFAARKALFAFLMLGIFILCAAPVFAHAQATSATTDFSIFNPLTWIPAGALALGNLLSFFLSSLISFAGLLLNLVLSFSSSLVQSPVVKTGFSICLALMNLGLVIAALFMAVATILEPVLGNNTYGIKQTLPKLILVAVLGNFLLLGVGTLIKFSDGLSFYFASQASPQIQPGGVSANISAFTSFSSKLAGAFAPQQLYNVKDMTVLQGTASLIDSAYATQWKSIINIFFIVVFELFIFVIMLLAAVMMLIRYVYLGVLAIFAPLAFLTYLFPSLKGQWTGWCTKLLHWTMFGPLMMLGLYLAILAAQTRGDYITKITTQVVSNPGAATDALKQQLGRDTGFFQTMAEMVMILGIAGGGIMMANAFAPKFAQSAMSGAQNLGTRAKGYMRQRGTQIATRPLATRGAQDTFGRMQGSSNIATRWAGRALEGIGIRGQRSGEEQAKKNIAGRSAGQINNNWSTMNDAEKIAALERLRQEGNLGLIDQKKLETSLPQLKGIMERQGKAELFEQVNKESGTELRAAMSNLAAAKTSGEKAAIDKANTRLLEATNGVDVDKIAATLFPSTEKLKNMNLGEVGLAELKTTQQQFIRNMLQGEEGDNLGDALKRISKNGQMRLFKDQLKNIKKEVGTKDVVVSEGVKKWVRDSAGAKVFGLEQEDLGVRPLRTGSGGNVQAAEATLGNFAVFPTVSKESESSTADVTGSFTIPKSEGGSAPAPTPASAPAERQVRTSGRRRRTRGGNGPSDTVGGPVPEPEQLPELVEATSGAASRSRT